MLLVLSKRLLSSVDGVDSYSYDGRVKKKCRVSLFVTSRLDDEEVVLIFPVGITVIMLPRLIETCYYYSTVASGVLSVERLLTTVESNAGFVLLLRVLLLLLLFVRVFDVVLFGRITICQSTAN